MRTKHTKHHTEFFAALEVQAQTLIEKVRLSGEQPTRAGEALKAAGGNKTQAARLLGWTRNKLRYALREQ